MAWICILFPNNRPVPAAPGAEHPKALCSLSASPMAAPGPVLPVPRLQVRLAGSAHRAAGPQLHQCPLPPGSRQLGPAQLGQLGLLQLGGVTGEQGLLCGRVAPEVWGGHSLPTCLLQLGGLGGQAEEGLCSTARQRCPCGCHCHSWPHVLRCPHCICSVEVRDVGRPGSRWALCVIWGAAQTQPYPPHPIPPLSPINQALHPCPYTLYTPPCPALYTVPPTPNLAHCTP